MALLLRLPHLLIIRLGCTKAFLKRTFAYISYVGSEVGVRSRLTVWSLMLALNTPFQTPSFIFSVIYLCLGSVFMNEFLQSDNVTTNLTYSWHHKSANWLNWITLKTALMPTGFKSPLRPRFDWLVQLNSSCSDATVLQVRCDTQPLQS